MGQTHRLLEGLQTDPDPAKEFSAVFVDGYVLLGRTENMRACLVELRKAQAADRRRTKRMWWIQRVRTRPRL